MSKAQTTSEVIPIIQAGPPAHLLTKMKEDAGRGLSTDQNDNQTPFIYVLQPLSPQVDKRSEMYIDGAEAGDIWLRNSSNPIVKGETGILFQPCYFVVEGVEWIPREEGGGLVGKYPWGKFPKDTVSTQDERNPRLVSFTRPNGTEIIETRSHAGFAKVKGRDFPYIISLTSTGLAVSKQWMQLMNSNALAVGGGTPAWAAWYKLYTRQRKNKAGVWFQFTVENAGEGGNILWASDSEYDRGKALHMAFASGEKQIDLDATHRQSEGDDSIPF